MKTVRYYAFAIAAAPIFAATASILIFNPNELTWPVVGEIITFGSIWICAVLFFFRDML